MEPQDPCLEDFLNPSISFKRWDYQDTPCASLCQMALDAKLYSQGADFTSWYVQSGGRPGSSYMKRFWEQDMSPEEGLEYQGGSIWILEKQGKPVGAVTLERCVIDPVTIGDRELHGRYANAKPNKTFQAQAVGRIAMWLDPALRKRGLMKLISTTDVIPVLQSHAQRLQAHGLFPFIRATDAAASILQAECDIPTPGFFRRCLNEEERLRSWMMSMGMDMHDHDRWGVDWRTEAKPKTRRPGALR